jgi:hypothetical protein
LWHHVFRYFSEKGLQYRLVVLAPTAACSTFVVIIGARPYHSPLKQVICLTSVKQADSFTIFRIRFVKRANLTMKKQSIKKLALKKQTLNNFDQYEVKGGAIVLFTNNVTCLCPVSLQYTKCGCPLVTIQNTCFCPVQTIQNTCLCPINTLACTATCVCP